MRIIRLSIKGKLQQPGSGQVELVAKGTHVGSDQSQILGDQWQTPSSFCTTLKNSAPGPGTHRPVCAVGAFAGAQGRLARGAAELTASSQASRLTICAAMNGNLGRMSSSIEAWRSVPQCSTFSIAIRFRRSDCPNLKARSPGSPIGFAASGPPLVLMPLSLAPSQWEPLIATLSARYCTISLGGPLLGVVGILEERGPSNYLTMVKSLLDLMDIRPNEVVLEVGGGSGVIIREIARRTAGVNQIIDVDISPYLLREAEALAKRAGLANRISFQEGNAEAIPLADDSVDVALSLTVMEEGDADRMLSELVRVTRPGGRIAAIVRSLDMPWWTNAALSPGLRAKVDIAGRGGVAPGGCADASLYQRFRRAGLVGLTCFSQLATVPASHVSRIAVLKRMILASLSRRRKAPNGSPRSPRPKLTERSLSPHPIIVQLVSSPRDGHVRSREPQFDYRDTRACEKPRSDHQADIARLRFTISRTVFLLSPNSRLIRR